MDYYNNNEDILELSITLWKKWKWYL